MNFIKILSYSSLLLSTLVLFSCSKDKNTPEPQAPNELNGLSLVTTITNPQHSIALYTASGKLQTGYNAVFFQIKDADGKLLNAETVTWNPVMKMMHMSHSCPASDIRLKPDAQYTYTGYIVFQMASNGEEYWELSIDYSVHGTTYEAKGTITVDAAPKRVIESFMGNDSVRYILALAEPTQPKVAINDMIAVLYRMESMMSFVPVDHYTIKIDPRMPAMGNHSSPNNVDLTQDTDKLYKGKLSLTMTGYWKINLQLEDAAQNIIKGEPVTTTNESSSIYFEIEF